MTYGSLRFHLSSVGSDSRCEELRQRLREAVDQNRTGYGLSVLFGLIALFVIGLLVCVVLAGLGRRKELLALAEHDPLTGLPNRRSSYRAYDRTAQSTVMSIALLDLDRFKDLNDRFGHAAGDEALQAFADVVRSGIRSTDIAARWGGEEFLLILPGTDEVEAAEIVDRMREAAAGITIKGAPDRKVAFSAGVAARSEIGTPLDDIVARADVALYSAKAQGRNRTVLALD